MIKSMTGYGKSSLSINSREYQIEIKTVNHKYIDTNIRIPRIISYLEDDVRKLITSKLKRGKVDVLITFENFNKEDNEIKINKELAKMYIESFKNLAEEENLSTNIEVTEITKLPDVLIVKNTIDEEQIKAELLQVVEEALNKLIEMRQNEGNRISVDILDRTLQIRELSDYVFYLRKTIKIFGRPILVFGKEFVDILEFEKYMNPNNFSNEFSYNFLIKIIRKKNLKAYDTNFIDKYYYEKKLIELNDWCVPHTASAVAPPITKLSVLKTHFKFFILKLKNVFHINKSKLKENQERELNFYK